MILTWRCVARPQCCYSNCRSITWSIHLVCISAASSSLGTPFSTPASSKRERERVSMCVYRRASDQASPMQGESLPISFLLLLFHTFLVFVELGSIFTNHVLKKESIAIMKISSVRSGQHECFCLHNKSTSNPDKIISNVMLLVYKFIKIHLHTIWRRGSSLCPQQDNKWRLW